LKKKDKKGEEYDDFENWWIDVEERLAGYETGGGSITESVVLREDGSFEVKYLLGDDD
jgi:hypothetical protein